LITEKGFHRLIPLMACLPDIDLLIAGVSPVEYALQQLALGLPNVRFLGLLYEIRVHSVHRPTILRP
jgi:hypothetical protein